MVPYQEMLERGLSLNLISYNTIIEALARGHMVNKVIYIVSKLVKNECCPNEFTYSVILNLLILEGQLGRLDEVIEMSKKFLNKSIYAYLVRTLSKLGHAGEAHGLSCNMWIYHDQEDMDAYMSMLESLCSSGKTTEALELLQNIHEKGVDPNTLMYNIVFSALKKSKQISQLHDLYVKMKLDGPSPDIFTYSILVSSFGRVGKVDKTVKVFKELEQSNCNPDVISHNSLINCLGNFDKKKNKICLRKNGDLDEAHIRFKEMQEKGLNPDVVTYSTLIECFGRMDKWIWHATCLMKCLQKLLPERCDIQHFAGLT